MIYAFDPLVREVWKDGLWTKEEKLVSNVGNFENSIAFDPLGRFGGTASGPRRMFFLELVSSFGKG